MRILILTILFTTFFPISGFPAQPKVTLILKETPLIEVLEKVSIQTNLSFKIDENLGQKKISGNFVENDIESFISKCLRGSSYTYVHEASNNTIIISTFGSQNNQLVDIKHSTDTDKNSPLITENIGQLRAKENITYEEYINNPKSIEPLSGMTLQEIAIIQKDENIAFNQYLNAPDAIEPLTGTKLQEIELLKKKENEAYTQTINNPKSIEPLSGMTFQKIAILHKRENEIYTGNSNPLRLKP
ncbi:hypothetical protein [Desulforhopalus sp. 52FAK]